jgi:pimeloyl-ACP methyl ester carboxylesterase
MTARLTSWQNDGLTFDVCDYGRIRGEPIVCLHGFPQDASAYDRVIGPLVEAGMRVLVPSQRGYAYGARPAFAGRYRLSDLTGDVISLLDAAGVQSAHVVGHDWGGAVGWALASSHGERVRSLVALSTPHPAALRAAIRHSTQAVRSAYIAFFQLPVLPEALLTAGSGVLLHRMLSVSGLDQSRARHYAERMQEQGAAGAALNWYRALLRTRHPTLGSVAIPTTLVAGRRDPFFSRAAVLGTAEHVTGRYRLVELDAGHWLPETHPDAVVAAVREQVTQGIDGDGA